MDKSNKARPRSGNGRFIAFRDLVMRETWPVTECAATTPATTKSFFFISHPWLSQKHPDPDAVKLAMLKRWWVSLVAFRKQLLLTDPTTVSRSERETLCMQRLAAAPVLLDAHDDEFRQWYSGFLPPPGLWLDKDTRPAAKALLEWLIETVDRVLEMDLWIDSWTIPLESHRAMCPRCEAIYQETIREIPRLLREADACVFLGGFAQDEHTRGWIQFEACAARALERLQGTKLSQSINDLYQRLYALDYHCTNEYDGILIPRLLADHRCDEERERSFPEWTFGREHPSHLVVRELAATMLTESSEGLVKHVAKLLEQIRSVKTCRMVAFPPIHAGRFLVNSMMHCVYGLVASSVRERGGLMPYDQHSLTYLKACIYASIVRSKHDSQTAARCIIGMYSTLIATPLLPHEKQGEASGDGWANELAIARETVRYWLADEENTIDITVMDLLEGSHEEVYPDNPDSSLEVEQEIELTILAAGETEFYELFGAVVKRGSAAITRLGISGTGISLQPGDRWQLTILLHDGRLWEEVRDGLRAALADKTPVVVESLRGMPLNALARFPEFDVRSLL
jgi:hypothetical protein